MLQSLSSHFLHLKKAMSKDGKIFNEMMRSLSNVSQMGAMMAACVLAGVFLGRFLDNLLGTSPWLIIIFSLLGVIAALKSIFEFANRK